MNKVFFTLLLFVSAQLHAQKVSRISAEVNFGIQGNFFIRSYEERQVPVRNFYNKNFIGTVGGAEISYALSPRSAIGIGYSRAVNMKKINYNNGTNTTIVDFNIRHVNNFYQLSYDVSLATSAPKLRLGLGLYYMRPLQQEVDVSVQGSFIEERSYQNSNLEEAGAFVGLQYSKQLTGNLDIAVRSRVYYTVSTNELESITFTPALIYRF